MPIQPISDFSLKEYRNETVESLHLKAKLFVIKAIAVSALAITVLALYTVGMHAFYCTAPRSYLIPAISLSSPLLSWVSQQFGSKIKAYTDRCEFYQHLADESANLREQSSEIRKLRLPPIFHNSQDYPLMALFHCVNPLLPQPASPGPQRQFSKLWSGHKKEHAQFEKKDIPQALQAATVLQFAQHPDQNINITPYGLEIPGVGTCHPRSYGQRQFGRNLQGDGYNDEYFTFADGRKSLTLQEIEEHSDPEELQKLLFAPPSMPQ